MDKCLRIVLCLSFLLFSEQHPAPTRSGCRSLGLKNLRKDVNCTSTLTFASPVYEKSCMAAAKRAFEEGLQHAIEMKCTDDNGRLNATLEALERCIIQDQNSMECTLQQKTFPEFVDDLGNFIKYNTTIEAERSQSNS